VEGLQSSLKKTFNQLGYRVTDTELKVIVKNSRNYEFWNVIQKLVLPGEDIKNIRLRLAAYHRAEESRALSVKLEALKQEKEELQYALDSSLTRNENCKRSITSIKSKIVEDVNVHCKAEEELLTGSMRGVLQRGVLHHCNNVQAKLKEQSTVIEQRTRDCVTVANSYQGAKTFYSSDSSVSVQSECTLALQRILSKLTLYNSKTHVSNELDSTSRANLRASIEGSVGEVQGRYSAVEVLSSMCSVTMSETGQLRASCEKMNISQDMQELELLMKDGRITETDKKLDTSKSLDDTVLSQQEKIRKEYITKLKHVTETKQLRHTQSVLLAEIEAEVRKLDWDEQDKTLLGALFKFQLRLQELESKEQSLSEILAKLSREKEEAVILKNATLDKYQQINTFKRRCEVKQGIIKNLLSHGGALRESISSSQHNISSFVTNRITPFTCLSEEIKHITVYPSVLTETLDALPLDRLFTNTQGVPVCDLPIYQDYYHGNQTVVHRGSETLDQCVFSQAGVYPYHSPEMLLEKVSELVCKEHRDKLLELIYTNAACTEDGSTLDHGSGDVLKQLRSSVFEFDTFTSETVLPRIEKYYNKCATALPKCTQIEAMIQEFVDQPGQHLAPWITVTNPNVNLSSGNYSGNNSGNYSNQSSNLSSGNYGNNSTGSHSGNYGNSTTSELTLRDVLERWIVKTAQTVSLTQTKVNDDQSLFFS